MREGSSQTSSIVVGSVGISLVAAISIPALFSIYWKFNPRKEQQYEDAQGRYEDEDGVATAESQEKFEYSTTLPKVLILASSVIGLLVSIAVAVLSTVHPGRTLFVASWINFGTWVGNANLSSYDAAPLMEILGTTRGSSHQCFR